MSRSRALVCTNFSDLKYIQWALLHARACVAPRRRVQQCHVALNPVSVSGCGDRHGHHAAHTSLSISFILLADCSRLDTMLTLDLSGAKSCRNPTELIIVTSRTSLLPRWTYSHLFLDLYISGPWSVSVGVLVCGCQVCVSM